MKKANRIIIYAGIFTLLLVGIQATESLIATQVQFAALFLILILMIWELFRRFKKSKNTQK